MSDDSYAGRAKAPWFLRLVTPVLRPRQGVRLQPGAQTVFVLSTGRTGTVYLADLMAQLDGVVSVHEPKPSRVLNAWTTAFLEGHVADDYMATALYTKRQKAMGRLQAQLYVESNNFIAGFAEALEQVFENPTIIHIVRDPRDFATSLTNRGDNVGIRRFFNEHVPYWAYVPKGLRKRDLTPLTRPLYRWQAINSYLSAYGEGRPNYHYFKFEDIFDKKQPGELRRLLSAMGATKQQIDQLDFAAQPRAHQPRFSLLDRPASSANASKYSDMAPWREWNSSEAKTCQDICGQLMERYGYGDEPAWRRLLKG